MHKGDYSSPKKKQINKNYLNSDSFLNELPKIYENEYIISFKDILTVSKKEFFENISKRIKYLINGKYNIEINNNEKLNTSLNSLYQHFEQNYNLSWEEITTFLDDFKHNPNNGSKNNYITNFRKHCWKTDEFAKHNCNNKNKKGYYIPIFGIISSTKINHHYNKNTKDKNEEKQIKYVICIECHKVFFSNKFLNYCTHCELEFYSYILNNNEEKNEKLLPGKWENDHCELIINQQIKCPKCNGIFYLDIKYNILKCLKCKFYRSPKNIERTCNICNLKFNSDISIYNPLEKDLLNDIINNSIINKNKAHPTTIPCCQNINIFSTEFYHSNNCKGKLYLAKYNKNTIIFCSECNKLFIYENFIWTCPECGKEFMDEKLLKKKPSISLQNEYDFSKKKIYEKNSINSKISSFNSSRKNIYEQNSLNSIKSMRNVQKSEPYLMQDLKKNIKVNRNVNINKYEKCINKDNYIMNKKDKDKVNNENKNDKINQLDNSKEIKKNFKNNEQNYNKNINNNNNSKRKEFLNFFSQRNSRNESQVDETDEKNKVFYNKSEVNLLEYIINNEKKISQKNNDIKKNKNNIPLNSNRYNRRSMYNIKIDEYGKKEEKNKNNQIFKRSNYSRYNLDKNEDKKNNNRLNLIINEKDKKNEENKNTLNNKNTQFNLYYKNIPSIKKSPSNFLYRKNTLNVNVNDNIKGNINKSNNDKKTENENKQKKEGNNNKKIINGKNIINNKYSKDDNPFNQNTSPRSRIKSNLLKNISSNNIIKEESKNEEKKVRNGINRSIKEKKKEENKRINEEEKNNKNKKDNDKIINYNKNSKYRNKRIKLEKVNILDDYKIKDNSKELFTSNKNINNNKVIDNNKKSENSKVNENNKEIDKKISIYNEYKRQKNKILENNKKIEYNTIENDKKLEKDKDKGKEDYKRIDLNKGMNNNKGENNYKTIDEDNKIKGNNIINNYTKISEKKNKNNNNKLIDNIQKNENKKIEEKLKSNNNNHNHVNPNNQEKEKEKLEKEKIKENKEIKESDLKNSCFSKKIEAEKKYPFSPISKNFQNSKNKIEIDLTKMKKLESSPSLCELNKVKNYYNIKKKNVIDEERAKLLKDIELEKKKFISNKPDDIVEHRKIDYKKDIIIEDPYLKNYPDLYEKMQKHLKQLIFHSHLPLFNPDIYQIESKIGEGTNGAIYQVVCLKSGKKYAMKKLIANDLIVLKYLIKEFDLVYNVIHPNILSIYGMNIKCFDSSNFSLSVLMDLGITDWEIEITDHFYENKFYTEEELINILKQLTSALLYLQKEKKIAHRDIKPENILVFENNVYKLGDFGEAKGTKVNNKLNTLRGTDIYMSPILYNGLKMSKEDVIHNLYKSDVFSLGYSFLYAVSLNHDIINEIRDLEDIDKVKSILYRMMKPRYSDTFIEIMLKMINVDEKTRIDFIGLDKLIKENFQ